MTSSVLLRPFRSSLILRSASISFFTRSIPSAPIHYSKLLPTAALRLFHSPAPNSLSNPASRLPPHHCLTDTRHFDAFQSHADSINPTSHYPAITIFRTNTDDTSERRNSPALSANTLQFHQRHRTTRERTYVTARLTAGIEKRRSIRRRAFASSTDSSNAAATTPDKTKKDTVHWREALKSPRKAIIYAGQLRRDVVDWVKHIWAGAKLLAADVRVSFRILRRITSGKQISRRERNFMVKTGVDLARLLPFSLFLIIPLAEFALPFALKLFPNMLPSQFQDQMKNEEDLKRRLKGRLELAKYLRDVVEEKAKQIQASSANSELKKNAEDLSGFLEAIRGGKVVDGTAVSRFAKFFNNELTIDGAVRPQLVAMCKYMGISPYGHDIFLRFKLRSRLNAIKKDDMEIMWEGGPDSLIDEEVAKACRDRGIKEGLSYSRMRRQLAEWLDLSQSKEIPSSLLILSRAMLYTGAEPSAEPSTDDGLVETLGSLPEDIIMDVKKAADVGDSSYVERLEETLRQAKLIEIESLREATKEREDEERKRKKEEEESDEKGKSDIALDESINDAEVLQKVAKHETEVVKEVFGSKKPDMLPREKEDVTTEEAEEPKEPKEKDEEESAKDLDNIRKVLKSLEELSSDSAVVREREELRNLKLELAEAERLVKETEGIAGADLRRFKSLVSKLEREVERVDARVGLRMKLLDQDNDGLMSLDECKNVMTVIAGDRDDSVVTDVLKRLDANEDGNISKTDLADLLHKTEFEWGIGEDDVRKSVEAQKGTKGLSEREAS